MCCNVRVVLWWFKKKRKFSQIPRDPFWRLFLFVVGQRFTAVHCWFILSLNSFCVSFWICFSCYFCCVQFWWNVCPFHIPLLMMFILFNLVFWDFLWVYCCFSLVVCLYLSYILRMFVLPYLINATINWCSFHGRNSPCCSVMKRHMKFDFRLFYCW